MYWNTLIAVNCHLRTIGTSLKSTLFNTMLVSSCQIYLLFNHLIIHTHVHCFIF